MIKVYTYEEFIRSNNITDEERYETCDICNGEGEHTCDCGYTHDCEECNGEGRLDIIKTEYERLCKEQSMKLEEWNTIFGEISNV